MSSNEAKYPYTLHSDGQIFRVEFDADGKETRTSISPEEYRRQNPLHKDIGCTECTYVNDKETLFLYMISREAKEEAMESPQSVGTFTMEGWTGHSVFYLFRCRSCKGVTVDYPHGYTNSGLCYLRCSHCQLKLELHPIADRAIYLANKLFVPNSSKRARQRELRDIIKKSGKRGIFVHDWKNSLSSFIRRTIGKS